VWAERKISHVKSNGTLGNHWALKGLLRNLRTRQMCERT